MTLEREMQLTMTYATKEMKKRLSRQGKAILEMLQEGPKTNGELVTVALSYTRRISDLRELGYKIEAKQNHKTGVTIYTLS